jgi:drug/metabolite transporter (DMT)-like permease
MSRHSSGAAPAPAATPPESSMTTVVGWLAIVFGGIPLLMVLRGDEGHVYLLVGAGLVLLGAALIAVDRVRRCAGR